MAEPVGTSNEDLELVAVIGLAGRFPGADGKDGEDCIEALWRNLSAGKESIRHFSAQELEGEGEDESRLANPHYVPARGVVEGEELFDASLFGISPREAALTDPQHRVFLECAWEALEVAGYGTGGDRVGVFAGSTLSTYLLHNLLGHSSRGGLADWQTGLLNEKDALSTRVSYRLDLKGPSLAVSTACSTSLVAVHLACQSLFAYECDMALAGGVTIRCPQRRGYLYHPEGILSPDGHCRAFDADANGVVFGSGAGVVVLKRLSEAIEDGDSIRAVVLGSAVNNDGAEKAGFTAPAEDGQAEVITRALAVSDVDPATIGYIEAHGTGTPLGDRIEVAALTRAFRSVASRTGTPRNEAERRGFCALGSLKSNIGHLDSAAGVAGLIKAVLSVERGVILPSLHYRSSNRSLALESTPFYVNTKPQTWQGEGGQPRRAGVSAFGIGGTNAHVIVQQPPSLAVEDAPKRSWQLLLLTGRTSSAVDSLARKLAVVFTGPEHQRPSLGAAAYTLAVGRRHLLQRRAVVVRDFEGAADALRSDGGGDVQAELSSSVAFLFPGQGSQYLEMGRGLYGEEPIFRQIVDQCAAILRRQAGWDLRSLIYPSMAGKEPGSLSLDDTEVTQPALFTIEVALAGLWRSWGIEPSAMLGHSLGEWVSAHLAGVWNLEQALRLVTLRGRLMAQQPQGSMLAVALPEEELLLRLPTELSVAAINGPVATVVSGGSEAVAAFHEALSTEGVEGRILPTSHAFHSPLMAGAAEPFLRALEEAPSAAPKIPFISNLSGTWIRDDQALDPHYWVEQMLSPVRFQTGLETLFTASHSKFLEVGPGRSLGSLARRHPRWDPATTIVSSSRHRDSEKEDQQVLLEALGRLWAAGVEANWPAVYVDRPRRRVPLPTYPFERERHWIAPPPRESPVAASESLGRRSEPGTWFSIPTWQRHPCPRGRVEGLDQRILVVDGDRIADALERVGVDVTRVRGIAPFGGQGLGEEELGWVRGQVSEWLERGTPTAVVYGGAGGEREFDQERRRSFEIPARWARALRSLSVGDSTVPPSFVVVTEELYRVVSGDRVIPARGALLGLCRSLAASQPGWSVRCIDVASVGNTDEASLVAEILHGCEAAVAWRGRDRWVETLMPVPLSRPDGPPVVAGGCYLITGGLGSTGLALARHLASVGPLRLAFLEEPSPEESLPKEAALEKPVLEKAVTEGSDAAQSFPEKALEELRQMGSEILVVTTRGRDEAAIAEALDTVRQRFGPLRGVLHLTPRRSLETFGDLGSAEDSLRTDDLVSAFDEVSRKIQWAFHLDALLRDEPLDFFICFSSFVALFGLPGRSPTAAAFAASGSCLDLLCQERQARDGRLAVAVHWGQNLGFRDLEEEWPRYLAALRRLGVPAEEATKVALTEEEAYGCLARVVNADVGPRVLVSTQSPQALRSVVAAMGEGRAGSGSPGSRTVSKTVSKTASKTVSETVPGIVPEEEPVRAAVADIWAEVLGVEDLAAASDFFELGGDSLVALQVVARIREHFDVDLPVRTLFDKSTVKGFAESVEDALVAKLETLSEEMAGELLGSSSHD